MFLNHDLEQTLSHSDNKEPNSDLEAGSKIRFLKDHTSEKEK